MGNFDWKTALWVCKGSVKSSKTEILTPAASCSIWRYWHNELLLIDLTQKYQYHPVKVDQQRDTCSEETEYYVSKEEYVALCLVFSTGAVCACLVAHVKFWSCSGFITSLWWGANGALPLPLRLLWLCVLHAPACPWLDHCHFDWYFHIVWLKAGVLNSRLSIKLSWPHNIESVAAWMAYSSLLFFIIAPPQSTQLFTLLWSHAIWSFTSERFQLPRHGWKWFCVME